MSRITIAIIIVLVLLVPSAAVAVWVYSQRVLPTIDGIVTMPDLDHPTEVRYDERGVPYIQAKNDHDSFLTQGFITASERMFQMEILRRTATGELAEIFGPNSLEQDKLMRKLGINRLAAQELKEMPKEDRALLDAYCKGINDYIDSANGKMPIQFLLLGFTPRQWQPSDSIAILKYLQYEEDESWQLDDLRQRFVDKAGDKFATALFEQNLKGTSVSSTPEQQKLISQSVQSLHPQGAMPPPLPIWGSNAWALSGASTDTKGAILAYDSHTAFTSPNRYYLCSMGTPTARVAGATIPGVPGIVAGRNDSVAWGATALHGDAQDLVLEQLSPQFPGKYRTQAGWDTMKEINEDVSVRFARPVSVKVLSTRHGPVLLQNDTTAVSLAWSGYETKGPALETIFQLDRAKNWSDFNKALSTYSGSTKTFVYADKNGNIGYHVAGSMPIRTSSGALVTPGWAGAADWHGQTKFDDLAHGYNPQQGYVVADNPQFNPTTYSNNPLRAIRVGNVLNTFKQSGQKVGLPEMAVLQGDLSASLAPVVKKELEETVAKTQVIDEFEVSALTEMRNWNGNLTTDSASASVYESFLRTLVRRVVEPRVGAKMTEEYFKRWPRWSLLAQKLVTNKPKELLPPEERDFDTFLVDTFAQSLKHIRLAEKNVDISKCTWGNLHQIRFQPIFNFEGPAAKLSSTIFGVSPVAVGGDQDTVNACNVQATIDPWNFTCDSGPTYRLLADMSDPEKFYSSLPLGQSEHLFSPYKTDQLTDWLHVQPHSIAFSTTQLEKQQQHRVIFTNQ